MKRRNNRTIVITSKGNARLQNLLKKAHKVASNGRSKTIKFDGYTIVTRPMERQRRKNRTPEQMELVPNTVGGLEY